MAVLSVIVVIGVLILVHELGHFLAAKSLKIPVKIFSIGFPLGSLPPLLRFKKGETDYQINWLPLGGFCAFMDDEKEETNYPEDSLYNKDNDPRYLNNRKVWERFVVISGGVVGNLIFAFFVAAVMFFSLGIPEGREFGDSVTILNVNNGSPADEGGLKRMDEVVAVDGIKISSSHDLEKIFTGLIKISPESQVKLQYFGENPELKTATLNLPEQKTNFDLGIKTSALSGIRVVKVFPDSVAQKSDLRVNDLILLLDGKSFGESKNPEKLMKDILATHINSNPVKISLLRNGEKVDLQATPDNTGKLGIGIEFVRGLIIDEIKDGSMAANSGLKEKSLIVGVDDGFFVDTASVMKQLIASHANGSKADLTVRRQGSLLNLQVIPDEKGLIGVNIHGTAKEVTRPPNNFFEPFIEATKYIYMTSVKLSEALLMLFSGNMSLKDVGGPVMVVAIGSEIAQSDITRLFHFTILISIELVILNLLPLPAVDGGHLFLLIIEKIRGKRLPREFEERIHYAGLLVLLGLGMFLIFKDVLTISKIIR